MSRGTPPAARGGDGPGLFRLAAPLMVSFWLRQALILLDNVYAGMLPGLEDASQAAIGLTAPFDFLMIACWVGTSNGLTARLGAALGAGDHRRVEDLKRGARRIIASLVLLFLAVAAGVALLAGRVGLEPGVAAQFRTYATVLLAGSAFTSFWSILPDSLVKAHHDTRSTMWAGLLSGFTNAALNTLFVLGFGWGIFGIAFSTVLGRLAGLAYALHRAAVHERRRRAGIAGTPGGGEARPARAILAIGLPSGLTFVLMSLESLAVNGLLARGPEPTAALAAWSVFDRVARFLAMPLIATSVAMLPLAARLWGAGRPRQVLWEARCGVLAGAAWAVAGVLPLSWLLGPWVARAWTGSEAARAFAEDTLPWVAPAVLVQAPLFLFRAALEGMQRPRPGLLVALARALVLVVPGVAVGLHLSGRLGWRPMTGACGGYVLGLAGAAALLSWWTFRTVGESGSRRKT